MRSSSKGFLWYSPSVVPGNSVVTPNQLPARVTFGPFEVNASAGELLKGGTRVRLPGQPFAILLLLLERPGDVVTREQLRERIWAEGTFVDFEHGVNAAMNKLRRALSDSAENPRYIETMPGRGYRIIGRLDSREASRTFVLPKSEAREEHPQRWRSVGVWERLTWAVGALICLGVGLRFHTCRRLGPIGPSPASPPMPDSLAFRRCRQMGT